MKLLIKRIFGVSAPSFSPSGTAVQRLPMDLIREHLVGLLHDCEGTHAQRIIFRINTLQTPDDLWLLRSDLLQCIARTHSQQEAVERINGLISVFEGWLPESQLAPI